MPRGGKRPGAGRKLGSVMTKTAAIAQALAKEGATPLEFLLAVMRDESQPLATRLNCAQAAAPFIHPRLATIHQTIRDEKQEGLQKVIDSMLAYEAKERERLLENNQNPAEEIPTNPADATVAIN